VVPVEQRKAVERSERGRSREQTQAVEVFAITLTDQSLAQSPSSHSQAGRRRFDPGRPLFFAVKSSDCAGGFYAIRHGRVAVPVAKQNSSNQALANSR
jgi:hypothetical protein